jgi:signal recognition particle GTPase
MKHIPKKKVNPRRRLKKIPLGSGMLKDTVKKIRKRQRKQKKTLKKLGI